MHLLGTDADFDAFQRVMIEAHQRHPIRILSYCVVSNHGHFAVWPEADGQVTALFRWLAHTHAMRWRVAHRSVGHGHPYQGRFKSFPVQSDDHLLTVLRYIEWNAVGAGLVARAEHWRWSGLWARMQGNDALKAILAPWPMERPEDWTARVNAPLSARELRRLRVSLERGRPFGDDAWVQRTASALGLEHTVRPEGRPPKPRNSPVPVSGPLIGAPHVHARIAGDLSDDGR
jgi:putative transposase